MSFSGRSSNIFHMASIGSASVPYLNFEIVALVDTASTRFISKFWFPVNKRSRTGCIIQGAYLSFEGLPMYFSLYLGKCLIFGLCQLCLTCCHIYTYKLSPVLETFALFQFYCSAFVMFQDIQGCYEVCWELICYAPIQ